MVEVIVRSGEEIRKVRMEEGASLGTLIRAEEISMPCGGKGTCGKCRIRASGLLSPVTAEERALLGQDALDRGWRLACMTQALGPVEVLLEERGDRGKILTAGQQSAGAGSPLFANYGVAVDIGTTTLAARLFGPSGAMATVAGRNPQASFGGDVISRMEKAMAGEGEALAAAIRQGISAMAGELAEKAGIAVADIDTLVAAGNTVMLHLLTGEDVEPLSHAPFAAKRLFGEMVRNETLFQMAPNTAVYLTPCISAFVGGDIAAALLATGMCRNEETAVLMDIGTNGEIALWHQGKLLCCSTAAGPAFEGAGIHMGMAGIDGAMDKLWLGADGLCYTVIGGGRPKGICGSGIVDAVAALLEAGAVDEAGSLEEDGHSLEPSMTEWNGKPAIDLGEGVVFTAGDVRGVQLAKGAVRAGLETLLDTAGVSREKVSRLYIAGGFGNYLDLENAAAIGLLPRELLPVAHTVGNAALSGAAMVLQNRELRKEIADLARRAEPVALDANPVFTNYYMEHMGFCDEE